jgi:membrane protease YdiL (CAAX protease family)
MKKVLHRIKASVLYFVFAFFVFLFVAAVTAKPDRFRFRNGEPVSDGQRAIYIFVFFLLVIIAGYGAFKSAQRDWRLWRKTHKERKDDHVA